jgi:hypothetical protein
MYSQAGAWEEILVVTFYDQHCHSNVNSDKSNNLPEYASSHKLLESHWHHCTKLWTVWLDMI